MRARIEIIQALIKAEMIGKIEKQSEKDGFEIHFFGDEISGQVVPANVGQEVTKF